MSVSKTADLDTGVRQAASTVQAATELFARWASYPDSAIIAGFTPRPNHIYTQVRAISARINQNYDGFPSGELRKSYRTFLGKPVFVNHANHDPTRARGRVVAARYVENGNDKYIDVVQEVNAAKFPKLAKELIDGGLDAVSMGCEAARTICSFCGNEATGIFDMCHHVLNSKGRTLRRRGKRGGMEDVLVFEECYDLGFFELSYVFDPADETAVVSNVLTASKHADLRPGDAGERVYCDLPNCARWCLWGSEAHESEWVSVPGDERSYDFCCKQHRYTHERRFPRWTVEGFVRNPVKLNALRDRLGYGEIAAPPAVDTLHPDEAADDSDDFHRYVDPPPELSMPDLDRAGEIDRLDDTPEGFDEFDGLDDEEEPEEEEFEGFENFDEDKILELGEEDEEPELGPDGEPLPGEEGEGSPFGEEGEEEGVPGEEAEEGLPGEPKPELEGEQPEPNPFAKPEEPTEQKAPGGQESGPQVGEGKEPAPAEEAGGPFEKVEPGAETGPEKPKGPEVSEVAEETEKVDEPPEDTPPEERKPPSEHLDEDKPPVKPAEDKKTPDDSVPIAPALDDDDLNALVQWLGTDDIGENDVDELIRWLAEEDHSPRDESRDKKQVARRSRRMGQIQHKASWDDDDAVFITPESAAEDFKQWLDGRTPDYDLFDTFLNEYAYADQIDEDIDRALVRVIDGSHNRTGEVDKKQVAKRSRSMSKVASKTSGILDDFSSWGETINLGPNWLDQGDADDAVDGFLGTFEPGHYSDEEIAYLLKILDTSSGYAASHKKGSRMSGSLADRGRVASRGRVRHQADQSRNDQGEKEETFLTQTPPAEPVETGEGEDISNTEDNLVAKKRRARAELVRRARAAQKRKRAAEITPDKVDPPLSGTDEQDLKGDFESVDANEGVQETNPKDAARRHREALRRRYTHFAKWVEANYEATPREAHSVGELRRWASRYAREQKMDIADLYPVLSGQIAAMRKRAKDEDEGTSGDESEPPEFIKEKIEDSGDDDSDDEGGPSDFGEDEDKKESRRKRAGEVPPQLKEHQFTKEDGGDEKESSRRREQRRKTADEKLDVAAPDGRVDVEAPTQGDTDDEAQASQFDKGDFGDNAGDDIAKPDLKTDQNFPPGEGKKSSRTKLASGLQAVRLAEAVVTAGLDENNEGRWSLASRYEKMAAAVVADRTALLERIIAVHGLDAPRKTAGNRGPSRSAVPANLGRRTATTVPEQRVAANGSAGNPDSDLFFH